MPGNLWGLALGSPFYPFPPLLSCRIEVTAPVDWALNTNNLSDHFDFVLSVALSFFCLSSLPAYLLVFFKNS